MGAKKFYKEFILPDMQVTALSEPGVMQNMIESFGDALPYLGMKTINKVSLIIHLFMSLKRI